MICPYPNWPNQKSETSNFHQKNFEELQVEENLNFLEEIVSLYYRDSILLIQNIEQDQGYQKVEPSSYLRLELARVKMLPTFSARAKPRFCSVKKSKLNLSFRFKPYRAEPTHDCFNIFYCKSLFSRQQLLCFINFIFLIQELGRHELKMTLAARAEDHHIKWMT